MITIQSNMLGVFKGMKTELPSSIKKGMQAVAFNWHEKTLGGHFLPSAMMKYNFAPRNRGYMIKKAKMYGHQDPIRFSGESKRLLTQQAVVSASDKQARVKMTGPFYLKFRGKKQNGPDLMSEIIRVTEEERQQMEDMLIRVTSKAWADATARRQSAGVKP